MADLLEVLRQTTFYAQVFFAWGLFTTIFLLGSWIMVGLFTPATAFLKGKFGKKVLVEAVRRDGVSEYRVGTYEMGFVKTKEGMYCIIPHTQTIYKGSPKFIAYEETGTPMHPSHAAAAGLMKSVGIPDVEVLEIFNVYLKDEANFNNIVSGLKKPAITDKEREAVLAEARAVGGGEVDATAVLMEYVQKKMENTTDYFIYPTPEGTFSSLLEHTKRVLGARDADALKRIFAAMKAQIPEVKDGDGLKKKNYPIWWTRREGLGCNILGQAVSYSDIKDLQIYHIDPSTGRNVIKQEAYRLYEKLKSARGDTMIKGAIAAAIIIGVMVFGYMILKSVSGGAVPQIPLPSIP